MNAIRLFFASMFLLSSFGAFAALPICAKNCDEHWNACIKKCADGPDGRNCKNICADQHEGCLNACGSGVSMNGGHQYGLLGLSGSAKNHYFSSSERRVSVR